MSEIDRLSLRFMVLTPEKRILFVYGKDETQARGRLPAELAAAVAFEPAGFVDCCGVLCVPPEEARAVTGSIVEGRVAPGA